MIRQRMARQQRARGARAQEVSVPLPTQGLFNDAKTASLSGVYAAELHNFRTDGISVETRKPQVAGPSDELVLQRVPFTFGSIVRYINLRAIQAEAGGAIFERQFDGNAMVAYISSQAVIVDGLDLPVVYNGTVFTNGLFTTSTAENPSAFDGVIAHQDRLFFWRTNGPLEFYYGGLGSVMGPLTHFPLDRLGNITGNIRAMVSVTLDAGENANDALCILTTTGQAVIYEGLDPGDATQWNLSSRLQIAPPLSRYGITRVGGDVWMMTTLGVVSLADTVQSGVLALVNAVARPISDEILALARNPAAEWQLHTAADGSQIIVNYYTPEKQRQFLWQTDSKTWATADYPARRWHNLVLATEFTQGGGRLGTILEDEGSPELITSIWHTGWFQAGGERSLEYIKPTIIAKGPLTVKVSVLRDYNQSLADIAEAEQTITIDPEDPPDPPNGRVALNEEIVVGVSGSAFQIRMEITATWAQLVQMKAMIA